jgi:hypothetical protein
MASDAKGGINFNAGAAIGSKYEIKLGRDNNPVVWVSWFDSLRFANWLHNGQGNSDTENGAYTLGALGAGGVPIGGNSITRNAGAKWWLPNESEWYKGGYHKNDGVTDNYWDYPTSTDAVPFSDQPPGRDAPSQTNTANIRKDDSIANGYDDGFAVTGSNTFFNTQNYLTNVGAYTLSASPYGTFDQGGNVYEWMEDILGGTVFRVLRGGSFMSASGDLLASRRNISNGASDELSNGGFRVAASVVPEPSTLLLLCLGSLAVFWRRRGLVCATILAAFVCVATSAQAADIRTVALSGQHAPGTPDGESFHSLNAPVLNDAGQTAFFAFRTPSLNSMGLWSEGSDSLALVARNGQQVPGMPDGVSFDFYFDELVLNDAGQTTFRTYINDSVEGNLGEGIWSEGSGTLALVARRGDPAPGTPSGVNYLNFSGFVPVLNDAGQIAFNARLTGATNDGGIWSEGPGGLKLVACEVDPAPGAPSGVNFVSLGRPPVMNDAGQTAFFANLAGPGVSPANSRGLWSEGSGTLALVARGGDHAPGTPSGVNFRIIGSYSPALNSAGQTVFISSLTGSGVDSTNDRGIWSDRTGSLALVARSGDQAPGMSGGANYGSFLSDPILNDAGQIAFVATLIGTGVDSTNDSSLWLDGSGSLSLVAREGDHAPGTPEGVVFRGPPGLDASLVLNATGQTAFYSILTGSGISASNDFGIWATDRSGELQLIAREGDLLEVAPGDFRTIGLIKRPFYLTGNGDGRASFFNNRGQLAFAAIFTDGSSGIFVSNRVAIPEPSTLLLLAASVCALVLNRRGRIDDASFNHRARKGFVVAIAVSGVIAKAPSTAYAADIRTVALTGAVFDRFDNIQNLVLNDAGQVAFLANSGSDTWSEGSGSLALLVTGGMQAPGLPDGVTFSRSQYDVQGLVLNDAGRTAFGADAGGRGIWSGGPGSLALVARGGDHAPGTPSGVNFRGNFSRPVLNNTGQTAFGAQLTGSGVDSANDRGIWSEGSGALSLVARAGSPAPGTPVGVSFGSIETLRPVLNQAGQIAFHATLAGSGVNSTNNESIWSDRSGSLAPVARGGDHAPGTLDGVYFRAFRFSGPSSNERLALNNHGHSAFHATLIGSGINATNDAGIWSEGAGTLALVARSGSQAAGTASGVNFNELSYPVLNDAGQTAFQASLAGSGVDATNSEGVWLTVSGNLTLIARDGDHAPGTLDGVNFGGAGAPSRFQPQLNDAGQVAFHASLTDGGSGIWATDRSGALQLVARTGDQLEVAPGDFRTISQLNGLAAQLTGNSDGRPSSFNNLGQIAFSASFTDSSSGVFVSNHVAIPEPSTLLLLLGSLAVLWRRRGPRSSLTQQCAKPSLLEMMVRGQRIGDAAILHQQKRKAIRQRPVLVRALLISREGLLKLCVCRWNDFDKRFRLKATNETSGTHSRIYSRQGIGRFDQHPGRCHQSADVSPTPFNRRLVVSVSGIHQRQQVVRVDKLNSHSPGFP